MFGLSVRPQRILGAVVLAALGFALAPSTHADPAAPAEASPQRILKNDPVLEWNQILLRAVLETNKFDPQTNTGGDKPPQVGREMAIVQLAVFDAVNSFDRRYEPYVGFIDVPAGASKEAAVVGAANTSLTALYGEKRYFRSTRIKHLSDLKAAGVDKEAIDAGLAVGAAAAEQILARRANDNCDVMVEYDEYNTAFGHYRMDLWTPQANVKCLAPHWKNVTPFAMTDPAQFRSDGPPAFDSKEYAQATNEVRLMGDRRRYDPANYPDGKLPEEIYHQKCTAFFWAAKGLDASGTKNNRGTVTPPGMWCEIARDVSRSRDLSIDENARLFALVTMGVADAGIVAWDMKYTYDLWRPIHAIRLPAREGDPNYNPLVQEDPEWLPLIATSNHPEYPSGHSTFSGTAAELLTLFFDGEQVHFACTGDDALVDPVTGVKEVRMFNSFWDAAREAGISRIYGGIHYQFSNTDGLEAGKQLGDYIFKNFLTERKDQHAANR